MVEPLTLKLRFFASKLVGVSKFMKCMELTKVEITETNATGRKIYMLYRRSPPVYQTSI